MRDERRLVTVLFADLAGSTALGERLDPEEVKLIVGEGIARGIAAVEAYGGTIKDIAGDGLLALFGAPLAHEDDAERAVRAALEIASTVADYGAEVQRAWGVAGFGARVAVHTGEAVTGMVGAGGRVEYGAVGDVVNTASRLQSQAPVGGVLISQSSRRLVGDQFKLGEARTLELKGRSEAVVAFTVLGNAEQGSRSVEMLASAPPLIGRESEMAQGERLLANLDMGRGGVLFVVGEPGIGKSRVAAEIARLAAGAGYGWFEGRCVSYGEALSLWPYRDLLRNWLGVSGQEPEMRTRVMLRRRLDSLLGEEAAEAYPHLALVLGLTLERDAAARIAQLAPESLQFRTFEVVAGLVRRLAGERPLCLLLDDLHWADPTSLALTERLLRVAEEAPLLLVVTQRPETEHGSWALKERAQRSYRHLFSQLELEPLSRERELELLGALAEIDLGAEASERILSFTEGNPFFLEEMVRALADGSQGEIPQTVEAVIQARLDQLDAAWRRIVSSASILGRTFPEALVQAVAEMPTEELREGLHHLLRLDLLRPEARLPDPVYRFKHALIQETAYRTLVADQRSELHRRAAEWFEARHRESPERVHGLLAHHWLLAHDDDRAIHHLKLAGERARGEWALDEAVVHFKELAPLLERSGRKAEAADALFALATTLHLAMRFAEADETWQRAFASWQPPDPPDGGPNREVRIMARHMPWDANPASGFYSANQRLHRQIHGQLISLSPAGHALPEMAEWWSVAPDGLTYQLRLKPSLRWHDGLPVLASDIVAGVHALLDPARRLLSAPNAFVLENAEAHAAGQAGAEAVGVRAVGPLEVEFRLARPAPYFPVLLSQPWFAGLRDDGVTHGAFQIEEITPERLTLVRHPDHLRDGIGNVRRVELVPAGPVPGAEPEVDVWLDGGSVNWPTVLAADLEMTMASPQMTAFLLWSGGRDGIDLNLKRALALATDRSLVQVDQPPNRTIATGGLVPPGLPGHTPGISLRYDPEAARRALAASSFAGPLRFVFSIEQQPPYAEPLLDSYRKVLGLDVELIHQPMAENRSFHRSGDVAFWHWVASWPDPEYFLRILLHSASQSNLTGWADSRFDDLLERAVDARDGATRLALFHEADRLVVQELCQVLPLQYARAAIVRRRHISGLFDPYLTRYDDIVVADAES